MSERTIHVGFTTTSQLLKALRAEAKSEGRSLSSHLHHILEQRHVESGKGESVSSKVR